MRKLLLIIIVLILGNNISGQELSSFVEGVISYTTSQNIYVKFETTDGIKAGDTLFRIKGNDFIPALIVSELSSISCVCVPVGSDKYSVGDKVSGKVTRDNIPVNKIENIVPPATPVAKTTNTPAKDSINTEPTQRISGRIALASYSNFSNVSDFSQRMRYNFSMNAVNIGGSNLSGETYISFVHRLKEWGEIRNDVFNGLKIYNLALSYDFNKKVKVWVGRKINARLSNAGAIDGAQVEVKLKSFSAGLVGGSRPDYLNYSFNPSLLQMGGYLAHDYHSGDKTMQNSIALVEQKNKGLTDRRFAYFQHTNNLIPGLFLFGSLEADLFNKSRNIQDSSYSVDQKLKLSNMYFTARYKFSKQVSMSLSFSSRKNIIYYETYKDIIDRLLEEARTQGYMAQFNYRPMKNLTFGVNAGYRTNKQDPHPSKNVYAYATYNNVPWLKAAATVSATFLETGYLSSSIYSAGLSRDLLPGKLYGGINYRWVKYKFLSAETPLVQNMAELNLTWRMMKKLNFSVNVEGTFEKSRNYERVYLSLTQRF
ncbi:MAG: hypothetical protein IPH45_11185 [Bacteroidales bacterium]|nr:hypothetical protein [Bacteroidales bacterium]